MTQPAGTVEYAYDAGGRLDTTTDWRGRVTDADIDRDGRLRSLARPNGVVTTWTYDAASRLTGMESERNGTVVQRTAYDLDADGNRTALRTLAGVETYGSRYAADQLTSVTYPGGHTMTFTYDAAGNRLTSKAGSAAQVAYTYDDASQLVSVGGRSLVHDANGNVVDDGTTTYDWDWLNRMTEVLMDAGTVDYAYNGAGNRVATTAGGSTTRQLYDLATDDGSPGLPWPTARRPTCRVRQGSSPRRLGARRRTPWWTPSGRCGPSPTRAARWSARPPTTRSVSSGRRPAP